MEIYKNNPTAIAVPINQIPSFYHIYIVDIKYCCCCYKPYFKLEKTKHEWILTKHNENKNFKIPLNKNLQQINDILIMIGLENRIMKLNLIQEDKIIKTKRFMSLFNLFNHILFIEKSIEGVIYTN